jgi:hypothetical protein
MLDQYESMRKAATSGSPLSQTSYGLALFLSRGMAGWLFAMPQLVLPPPAAASAKDSDRLPDLPVAAQTDLTLLLADMVLACQTETGR